jgi:hypothetical protein
MLEPLAQSGAGFFAFFLKFYGFESKPKTFKKSSWLLQAVALDSGFHEAKLTHEKTLFVNSRPYGFA